MKAIRDIIRAEIHATADEIRRLKRWWRTPPDRRTEPPATRFPLHPSRQRATLLCMVMAHSRGRLHLRSMAGIEQQAAALREALDAMERMKRQMPLFDAALQAAARAILAWDRRAAAGTDACVAPTAEHRA